MIHAKSYAGLVSGAELIAICDADEKNLEAAQKIVNVRYVYNDYREALKNDEIDAVIVVTPTRFHKDIVCAAANAGRHIFCEKPMASSPEECDEMIESCRKNNVKLQIGFMRRFDKNFKRGREIIDSGVIGPVAMIKSNTYGPMTSTSAAGTRAVSRGGSMPSATISEARRRLRNIRIIMTAARSQLNLQMVSSASSPAPVMMPVPRFSERRES